MPPHHQQSKSAEVDDPSKARIPQNGFPSLISHGTHPFRSGFVALVGRPNVGKSTLLNSLVGSKVAIVSDKPQTTRNRILGISTDPDSQIIFLDTPGIHKPKEAFNRLMVGQALDCLHGADLCAVILDGSKRLGEGDQFILDRVKEAQIPFVAILNKIDLLRPESLAQTWERFLTMAQGSVEQVALSALHDSGTAALLKTLKMHLPEGPKFYPDDTITDRSIKFQIAELIREQIFRITHEEIPYATAVLVNRMEEREREAPSLIEASIAVESSSQKGILIGKHGEMLKRIGTNARKGIEKLLGHQVYLQLQVEILKGWRRDPKALRELGYTGE